MADRPKVAHRRRRLKYLIETDYGKQADFLRAFPKMNQGEISGLLHRKSFAEVRAENLAVLIGLDKDWFDTNAPTPKELAARDERRRPVGAKTDRPHGQERRTPPPQPQEEENNQKDS